MIRSGVIALTIALAATGSAAAQTASSDAAPQPGGPEFLSRFAFQVGMERLFSEDPRFEWDAHWGGELDLVDYRRGALTFVAAYQTILGDQFREFDPNQGDYTLGGSASARVGAVEVAAVFHHVSRHLSDRPKRVPVDWNMMGGRLRAGLVRGRTELQGRVDVRRVVEKSFVDYQWEADGGARAQVRLTPRMALVARGAFRVVGVDDSRGRGDQFGWRSDGAIRLDGTAAALELFVAAERRIDPYQLEFSTATWVTSGFRLLSR
ncbi:MAG: hypothetical protein ACRD3C_26360 [Vicinamibacterales bacterium]